MLTRTVLKDEWDRVKRYASWMRSMSPFVTVAVPDDVFRQLSFATSGGPVCPQLQHLTWISAWGWDHSRKFLSSHLVSVFFWQDLADIRANLALAAAISPLPTTHLQKLILSGYLQGTAPIHLTLSKVVQQLNVCFKQIDARSSLSDAAWGHLASLPKLESLSLSNTPSIEVLKSIPHEPTFPALKCMTLELDSRRQHLQVVFPLLKSSPLQEVTIKESLRIRHDDVPSEVAIALIRAELHQRINTLVFTGFHPVNLTFVSHLGPFNSLETLVCDTQCHDPGECAFPLTDSDIERLANGLPQLLTLRLGHECEYGHYNLTIKSMISLSTHCLSLDTLYLPCDLTNTSEDAKTESGEPDPRLEIQSSCMLRNLAHQWVTVPPRDDTEALKIVTSALRHLFPQLQPIWE